LLGQYIRQSNAGTVLIEKSQQQGTKSSRGHTETKLVQHWLEHTKSIQDFDTAHPAGGFHPWKERQTFCVVII